MRSNGSLAEPVDFATLVEIAKGVPRSFPFHGIAFRLLTKKDCHCEECEARTKQTRSADSV
jgi:hypothetical protein